jgi:amino acid adenylation domain-containing protein
MPVVFTSTLGQNDQPSSPFAAGLVRMDKNDQVYSITQTPQVWLDHQVAEVDGDLMFNWDSVEELFSPGALDDMWRAYNSLLDSLTSEESWQQRFHNLLPEKQITMRKRVNATEAPLPHGLLHTRFVEQARKRPDRVAVISRERELTYSELNRWSDHLALRLRDLGCQPNHLVAIVMEKGWQQVLASLAILKSGAAYLPIDAGLPAERLRFLLTHGDVRVALTQPWLMDRLEWPEAVTAIAIEGEAPGEDVGPIEAAQQPDDLAYVIFTSGSTGQPKGVMIDHRGALNTIVDINHRLALSEHDVVFGVSELHFDLSVWDIFGTLSAGATLLLPATGDGPDPRAWARLARERGVTVWNSVPALMQLLADELEAGGQTLPALRAVMLSGDWIPLPLPARVRGVAPRSSLLSLGGATEAAIWSIAHPIGEADPDWPSVPYGRPLLNQRWHVLQEDGRPAPDWVPGELCIAGAGLAQGYCNDGARTAAAFRTDAHTGERLYHTGDIGRYRPDGNIEFLGRLDNQVKVHGLRVEPGEIEQALTQLAAVSAAAVMVDDGAAGRRLVAFVVAERGAPADDALVFGGLRDSLPAHLLPSALVWLPGLPLTATGKLDRKALAKLLPQPAAQHAADVAPRNALEAALARLWQQVLGRAAVGVHDDFFALGGQSFSGLQLVGRVRHELGLPATLGMLLEARTVALLAQRLGAGTRPLDAVDTAPAASVLVPLGGPGVQPGNPGAPVFCVHPAGGSVWAYRPLAQQMGAPVFGLQAPALESGQAMPATIEVMAAAYVQALQRAQPSGPVRLMGWSSGGVIAFEMARQLEQQGRAVEQLVVLDCPAPGQHDMPDDDLLLRWFLQDLAGGVQPVLRPGASIPAGATLEAAMAAVAWPATQPQPPAAQALAPAFSVFQAVVRAVRCYHPKEAAVEAGVLLLRASEGAVDEFSQHPDAAAPDWGWRAFTRGPLRVLSVPGHHHTVLDEASMRAWLPAVREAWRNGGRECAAGAGTASGA